MTRFGLFPISALFLLTACSNGVYYRQGASFATMDRELTNCQVSALRKAPVANQTRLTPLERVNKEYCNAKGCRTQTVWVGGDPYQVDVNTDLRTKVETQCMAENGYRWVELPTCPTSVSYSETSAIMPVLSKNSCVAHGQSGRWQIGHQS